VNLGYILGLTGMWLLCDAMVSIKLRWGKDDWGYHLVRLMRGAVGICMIVLGYSNL